MNKSNSRSDQGLLGAQPDVVRQTVDDSLLGLSLIHIYGENGGFCVRASIPLRGTEA